MKLTTKNYYDTPNFFDEFFTPFTTHSYKNGFMRADVSKRKGNYVFDIDVPGYQKEDIKVKLDDGYLTILVDAKKSTTEADDCEWLHQERFNGEFSRSFYIGCPNDTNASASYHNGVLTVVIPDKATNTPDNTKYITIK